MAQAGDKAVASRDSSLGFLEWVNGETDSKGHLEKL